MAFQIWEPLEDSFPEICASGQHFNDDSKDPRFLFSAVSRFSFHSFDLHQKSGASHKILFTFTVSPASVLTTTDPVFIL